MSEPLWKKELSFKRKPKAAAAAPSLPPVSEAAPVEPSVEGIWRLSELRKLVTRRMIDFPQRADEWESYLQRLSEYERGGYVPEWFNPLIDDVFALAFAEPVEAEGEPVPLRLAEILPSAPAPATTPAPVEPVPLPLPVVEPPAAPELPPAAVEAVKAAAVPFWKRELGRKAKTAETEQAPKAAKAASAPFWKRELGRKKAVQPATATPETPKAAKAASVPFWKRELGRKKAVQPAATPDTAPKPAKAASAPFWKRELGRKKAAPPAAAEPQQAAKAAKPGKTPFWKLELSRKPKAGGATKPAASGGGPFWTRGLAVGRESLGLAPGATPLWKRDFSALRSLTQRGGGSSKSSTPQALVGLKIGASQIAAACVDNNGSPHLQRAVRVRLAEGIVVNGDVREPEALTKALKDFFADQKLPKIGVRLGIASSRVGVRTFTLSGIADDKQLENAIRFRAQEVLPIPLEEAVLDWQVLEEKIDDVSGEQTRRVLLVVAHRDLVQRYVDACAEAGIRLAGVDLEAFALLRALQENAEPGAPARTGALVAVNVGHDRSTFAVSDGRICEFTRVLSWGGSALTVAIARALDLTPTQAEPIKHAMAVGDHGPAPEGLSPEKWAAAGEAVEKELQAFVRELVSSLRFYQNQPASLPIAELVLTGGAAQLPGFAAELNRLIGVPVRVGDPLGRVQLDMPREELEDVGSLAVAIGLGIQD